MNEIKKIFILTSQKTGKGKSKERMGTEEGENLVKYLPQAC